MRPKLYKRSGGETVDKINDGPLVGNLGRGTGRLTFTVGGLNTLYRQWQAKEKVLRKDREFSKVKLGLLT